MKKQITKIINNWNPIEIYPLLESEYEPEIKRIIAWITVNREIDSFKLAQYINEVFIEYFGSLLYKIDKEKVLSVAKKIIQIKDVVR